MHKYSFGVKKVCECECWFKGKIFGTCIHEIYVIDTISRKLKKKPKNIKSNVV